MDPEVLLLLMVTLAKRLVESDDDETALLAQQVLDLDEWMRKGGAIPASWRPF